jgi:predicted amidohydrolase
MNVLAIQLDIAWHDKRANHDKVRRLLDREQVLPGSLLVLPEMFATGFSMDVPQVTDQVIRETETFLTTLARERNVCIIGGLVSHCEDGRGRNEALVAFPDGKTLRYHKIHPFTLGGESDHYLAGRDLLLFEWQGFQVAPFICYDLRFPEIFRAATRRGAQVLAVIANWPSAREEHWLTLLRARAIENQCYVIGVNRSGNDPKFSYPGRTQIIGPKGGIIADAGAREGCIAANLSLQALLDYRTELPFLKDMKQEFVR